MKKITPKQLKERLDKEKITILDVRSKEKFQIGRLKHPNAEHINIFKEDIFHFKNTHDPIQLPIPQEQEIVITCTSGNSAKKCADILTDKGYNVTLLEGGMMGWNQENH